MNEPSPDDYKRRQAEFYAGNAAGWERWAETVAQQAEGFNAPLLQAAGIAPGQRVLDLASGAGEPALSAAKAVGEGGRVTATDLSPEMLGIVERRAKAAKLGNVECKVADMEALPFKDGSFDRVISRFGIMYSPEIGRTLPEVRRVLKPGGRAAFMVWGPLESNSLLWTVLEVANAETGLFEGDEVRHPFCYGAPGSLAPHLERAGFRDVAERELQFHPKIKLNVPFWTPIVGMNFGAAVTAMSGEQRRALDRKVGQAFERYIEGEAYRVSAHVRIALGDKA